MRAGVIGSTVFHGAVIALAYWGLPWREQIKLESEPIPVMVVTEISERTTAQRKVEEPKPPPKPEPPKPEPPKPEPPKPEPPKPEPPKPEPPPPAPAPPPPPPPPPPPKVEAPKPEPKPEPKPQEIAQLPTPKPEAKPEPPKPQAVVKPPEPKPEPKKPQFDMNQLALLLDKKKPAPQAQETDKRARQQAAPAASSAPSASNLSEQLSMSEKDAIRQQIQGCWHFDAGARDARNLRVLVRFSLNPDGSVRGTPEIVDRSRMGDPYFRAFAESAVRAVQKCSPLKDLPPRKYDAWRDVELNFDPREMLGG